MAFIAPPLKDLHKQGRGMKTSFFARTKNRRKLLLLLLLFGSVVLTVVFTVNLRFFWMSSSQFHNVGTSLRTGTIERNGIVVPKAAQRSSTTSTNPSSTQILYIHVGKTGGEFLKSQLQGLCFTRREKRLRQECHQKFQQTTTEQQPLPLLSKYTTGYNHASANYLHSSKTTSAQYSHVLFSIRHPLSRLVSWYKYNHPKSCDYRESQSPSCQSSKRTWTKKFFQCFPALETLTTKVASTSVKVEQNKNTEDHNCSQIFWNGWYGQNIPSIKEPNHLYWNYHFYWNQTKSEILTRMKNNSGTPVISTFPKILVLRQESLKEDAIQLEAYLEASLSSEGKQAEQSKLPAASSSLKFFPLESQHFVKPWMQPQMQLQTQQHQQLFLRQQHPFHPTIGRNSAAIGGSAVGNNPAGSTTRNIGNGEEYGGLSKSQKQYLCECVLWDELQIYQHLLLTADNLNKQFDNEKSYEALKKYIWEEGCGYDPNDTAIMIEAKNANNKESMWQEMSKISISGRSPRCHGT